MKFINNPGGKCSLAAGRAAGGRYNHKQHDTRTATISARQQHVDVALLYRPGAVTGKEAVNNALETAADAGGGRQRKATLSRWQRFSTAWKKGTGWSPVLMTARRRS
ncbi:hypothetical protein [Massilia sp. PWRC2]|uniref:hypothetical protein n=1 Tax=Massilia sp. PWRC2 TaxID=2804626 RepID=UPI003CFA0E81